MTELSSEFNAPATSVVPDAPVSSRRWPRAIAAALLSLFVIGTGQLLNRQPRKGLLFAVISTLGGLMLGHTRALLSFSSMVVVIVIGLAWRFFVAFDAAYCAAKSKKSESPIPVLAYLVLAAIMIAATLFPSPQAILDQSGFHAFKIPSVSMCPTVCLGDRLVADMNAYKHKLPQRGELIIMKYPSSDALFVKRVIGLPGDLVAPGPNNSVLVNGKPLKPPPPCSMPTWTRTDPADYSSFRPVSVPDGSFFVVGDNLENSYDSRIPEFGPVTSDMLRGKPSFFYWSPTHSRIGCTIN